MESTLTGPIKLSADLVNIVNSSHGSDVRFLVGPNAVIMHGHSAILRCRSNYFAMLLEDDNEWKEKGDIQKPNISPVVFHALLSYIYTGNITIDKACRLALLTVAEDMELYELSIGCQVMVMETLNQAILANNNEENYFAGGEGQQSNLPITVAIRRLLIPALVLAYNHTLTNFFQELLDFTVKNIETILNSKETFNDFLNAIPFQILHLILSSDSLPLGEYEVWDLALEWACRKTNILKLAVELQLKSNSSEDGDKSDTEIEFASTTASIYSLDQSIGATDQTLISELQLKALKKRLRPLLPAIRFTLMDPEQYSRSAHMLSFFLSTHRLTEIQRYLCQIDKKDGPDIPRTLLNDLITFDSNIANAESQRYLRKWIFEAKEIADCNSLTDLNLDLLYRASTHGFQASVFHKNCDNKGPTLVLVKTSNGYNLGGVNFLPWTSKNGYSNSATNFLFALKDGKHRHESAIFKATANSFSYAAYNHHNYGPTFGKSHDLHIADVSDTNVSSYLRLRSYRATGATFKALAGVDNFMVEDYEVFAISGIPQL